VGRQGARRGQERRRPRGFRHGGKDRLLSALRTRSQLIAELGAASPCADFGVTDTPRADHPQYLDNCSGHGVKLPECKREPRSNPKPAGTSRPASVDDRFGLDLDFVLADEAAYLAMREGSQIRRAGSSIGGDSSCALRIGWRKSAKQLHNNVRFRTGVATGERILTLSKTS